MTVLVIYGYHNSISYDGGKIIGVITGRELDTEECDDLALANHGETFSYYDFFTFPVIDFDQEYTTT